MSNAKRLTAGLAAMVLVMVIVSSVDAQTSEGQGRYYPEDIREWGHEDWLAMTDSEQWFFLHGMALASWVYGHTVTQITRGFVPTNDPVAEIEHRLITLEAFLEANVNDTWRDLQTYYQQGGRMPLWQAPYKIRTLQEQGDNE